MTLHLLTLAIGLVVLYLGAEFLVRGSSSLAVRMGVGPMVVGLTVVAIGTSLPEALVSWVAAYRDVGDLAVGNVVGSNIANIGLVLASAAAIRCIRLDPKDLGKDLAFMVSAAVLGYACAFGGISLIEGTALGAAFAGYIIFNLTKRRDDGSAVTEEDPGPDDDDGPTIEAAEEEAGEAKTGARQWSSAASLLATVLGAGGLVLGAELIVRGGTGVARILEIPELVIGITIVAVGTSIPELATSVVAALKGEPEIAVGNVIGSNIANIFMVLGPTAVVSGSGLDVAGIVVSRDWPIMLLFSAITTVLLLKGRITRLQGAALLVLYAGFILLQAGVIG